MIIYQQPECVSDDNVFTVTDLLNVEHDFPQSPYVYFGNSEHSVICIVSPFNPAEQWCSGKAPDWSPPPFTGWYTGHYVLPPDDWQPVVTPEPAHVVFLLVAILLSALIRTLK